MGQLTTAARVLRAQGVAGVMSAFKDRYLDNWIGKRLDWCYGKALEIRGNVITIDGCTFSLESPVISTESKSKFMFDRYERPEREAVRRFLDPSLPVVEFGGSIGVVSCLTNRRLRDPRRHVVVEANPALVPLLQANRDRNHCRFTILPCVVAYGSDQALFYVTDADFVVGSATPRSTGEAAESVRVATTDLRSIVDRSHFDWCTLICDIEGGESDLIRHEPDILRRRVATLILEIHEWSMGRARAEELFRELADLGFQTLRSERDTFTFGNAGFPARVSR